KRFAQLRGDGNDSAEQIISSPPAIELDATENVIDRFLLETGNAVQLVRLAQGFELFDGLNAELIVDLLCCLRTDARNFYHLGPAERNLLLQLFMKFHPAGPDVFFNLVREIFPNPCNVA